MNTRRNNRKAVLGTAMAAVLIVGYGGSVNAAPNNPAHEISKKAQRNANKAIAAAEKQAAKRPQDAAVRASLGNAYLLAGRFESAVTAFEDARYLGDTSARSALGLSLAHVGVGNGAAAVSVLDSARDVIPVSDYGLALALAGETGRGVDVLSQALRGGENTSKLRQNLAYAYALDGRWNDARVMASQDVPLDKLDARITEWARQGRPEDFRLRVASMLGTTVRTDQGQPANLALSRDPTREVASLPVPRLASAPAAAGNGGELPPVDNRDEFWVAEATRPEPVTAPPAPALASAEVAASPPVSATNDFAAAFPKPTDQLAYTPVAAKAEPALTAKAEPAVAAPQPVRKTRKVARANNIFPGVKAATGGSHLVQLGAFSSQANAERAWSIFRSRNPELAGFDRVMTQAIVGGKKYWRVSAGGFDRNSARQMCTTVRNRGGGCITWASGAPLPGAIRKD